MVLEGMLRSTIVAGGLVTGPVVPSVDVDPEVGELSPSGLSVSLLGCLSPGLTVPGLEGLSPGPSVGLVSTLPMREHPAQYAVASSVMTDILTRITTYPECVLKAVQ
jgi:hypothetical protein